MPLVRLNPTLLALHGRIGDRVYKTYGDGRVIVTRVPDFSGYTPTAAQRARRDRMRAATAYAQRVYADPAAKALYVAAAHQLGRCAFRLAISDHLAGRVRVPDAALVSPPITPQGRDASPRRPPHRPTTHPSPPITPAAVGRGRRTPPGSALPRIAPMSADPNPPSTPPMPAAGRDVSPRRPPCTHVRRLLLRGRLGEPSLATAAFGIACPPPRRARSVFIRGHPRHPRSRSASPPANIADTRGLGPPQLRFRCIGLPAALRLPPASAGRHRRAPSALIRHPPETASLQGIGYGTSQHREEATGKLRL